MKTRADFTPEQLAQMDAKWREMSSQPSWRLGRALNQAVREGHISGEAETIATRLLIELRKAEEK